MHIALVSEHASPLAVLGGVDAGGQNVYVAELAQALAEAGLDVTVHTRRDDPTLAIDVHLAPNIRVHHVDAGPAEPIPKDDLLPYMGAFAQRLGEDWDRRRPDVAHAHFWMSGLASVIAARPRSIPVMLTYHASGLEKARQQGPRDTSPPERIEIERRLATAVDRVIATTAAERAQLLGAGVPPSQVAVVPCGVDLLRFSSVGPAWPPRGPLRRIVVVSRLVERKGIGNVLEALASLEGTELIVAGGPPDGLLQDDPEAQRLLELASQLGVADRLQLLGAVPRRRIPTLLRSADVVACCPWYEPFGMVAVEAMACGRPVVATGVGGLAETVRHGHTGILVTPRCPTEIADALRTVLDDPALARDMGRKGERRARRYGWSNVVAELLAQVHQLCGPAERTVSVPVREDAR